PTPSSRGARLVFGPSRRAEAPAWARRRENRSATYWKYVSTGSAAAAHPGGMHTAAPAMGETSRGSTWLCADASLQQQRGTGRALKRGPSGPTRVARRHASRRFATIGRLHATRRDAPRRQRSPRGTRPPEAVASPVPAPPLRLSAPWTD